MIDVIGNELNAGDRVGIAFSYSRSSVGYIRVGTIVSLEPEFRVHWEDNKNINPVSPPLTITETRIVRIS